MFNVTFHGETAGSCAKLRKEGKTTDNVAYSSIFSAKVDEPQRDVINFRGNEYYSYEKKKTSMLTKIICFAGAAAAIIGGLGYAHKAGWISKIGNAKVKDFMNKIAEPCHKWCGSLKQGTIKIWDKIKNCFSKKP